MLSQIKGLHHVTSMAADAQQNNDFFTKTLGLRRVKKTVNFDAPDVYHLYYGDEVGSPGSVMTYFPFPHISKGRPGAGEVGQTVFAVPKGSLRYWADRLAAQGVAGMAADTAFGEQRLRFAGPDGDGFALVEVDGDPRAAFNTGPVPQDRGVHGFRGVGMRLRDGGAMAEVDGDPRAAFNAGPVPQDRGVHGFRGVGMRLRDGGAMAELLGFMNYEPIDRQGDTLRFAVRGGNGADIIDIQVTPEAAPARQGAGSVHHIAFAVENRAAQLEVRKALIDTGHSVTPVIDRDYFWAIYFRTPGGVLFEVATNEPGFDRDEDTAHLGQALKLPGQHAHLRDRIEALLPPIRD